MNKTDNKRKLDDLVPIVGWLRQYPKEWLRPDLIAGLTAAAVSSKTPT